VEFGTKSAMTAVSRTAIHIRESLKNF